MRPRRPSYTAADDEEIPTESRAAPHHIFRGERSRWRRDEIRLRKVACLAAFAVLAVLAGALTASKPKPTVIVAGVGFVILLSILTVRAFRARRSSSGASEVHKAVPFLILCYVVPMLVLSRVYALIGHNPLYLPDVLITVTAGVALFRTRWRHLGLYAVISALIGLLMLHAVEVGRQHHYASATKGLVLVIYPLVAVPIAGWITQRTDIERLLSVLPRFIFPLIPLGMVIVHHLHRMVPSAYGLEYACAGSFCIVAGLPGRKLTALSTLVGAGLLISFSAKRGVEVTLVLSIAAAWVASKRLHKVSRRTVMLLATGAVASVFVISVVEGIIVLPSNIPLVSHIAKRATGSQAVAAENVTFRKDIWTYTLKTSWDEDPIFGVGAYHPIGIDLNNNNLAAQASIGAHNSFIGYTFYAGYPEGALVLFVYLWGLLRLWRVRRRSPYAAALFGCLVAAILTAGTNVAFELTYIGGPSWLILGLAFGYSARLMDEPDPPDPIGSVSGPEPALASEREARTPLLARS